MTQSLNFSAIFCTLKNLARPQGSFLPSIHAPTLSHLDWCALKRAGYKAICFDKDSTLTSPYSPNIHESNVEALEECKRVFPTTCAILSNSVGTPDFPTNTPASIHGLSIISHLKMKKPLCWRHVLDHFEGVEACEIVVIGDRLLTDMQMANEAGMLGVLVDPPPPPSPLFSSDAEAFDAKNIKDNQGENTKTTKENKEKLYTDNPWAFRIRNLERLALHWLGNRSILRPDLQAKFVKTDNVNDADPE